MADTSEACLQVGWRVVLHLKRDAAPLRAYVGVVVAVDQHGVRLTLMDWLLGVYGGDDFFAPWDSIASAMIGTDEDDGQFERKVAKLQDRMCALGNGPLGQEQSEPRSGPAPPDASTSGETAS